MGAPLVWGPPRPVGLLRASECLLSVPEPQEREAGTKMLSGPRPGGLWDPPTPGWDSWDPPPQGWDSNCSHAEVPSVAGLPSPSVPGSEGNAARRAGRRMGTCSVLAGMRILGSQNFQVVP